MNEDYLLKLSELEEKWTNFNKKKLLLILPFIFLIILIVFIINRPEKKDFQKMVNQLIVSAQNSCRDENFVTTIVFKTMVEEPLNYSGIIPESGRIAISKDCELAFALYDENQCAKKYFSDVKFEIKSSNRYDCHLSSTIFDERTFIDKIAEGYIPIKDHNEFLLIENNQENVFGKETPYQATYQGGLDKKYILLDNIDFKNITIHPIGSEENPFSGIIDGAGFTIKNLVIEGEKSHQGLFSHLKDAKILNLELNIDATGGEIVGGLAGVANNTKIENVLVKGTIKGDTIVGGLFGLAQNTDFIKVGTTVNVSGNSIIGGVVGQGENLTFKNCFVQGHFESFQFSSGFVGSLDKGRYEKTYSVTTNNNNWHYPFSFDNAKSVEYIDSFYVVESIDYVPELNGRLIDDMKKKKTYLNWDFEEIWKIDESKGFPLFR